MDKSVKNELEKNINMINKCLDFVVNEKFPTETLIHQEFASIKILLDYCEELVIKGKDAIEVM